MEKNNKKGQDWIIFRHGRILLSWPERKRIRKIIKFYDENPQTKKVSILRLSKEIKEPRSTLSQLLHKINGAEGFIIDEKKIPEYFHLTQVSKRFDKKILKPQIYVIPDYQRN